MPLAERVVLLDKDGSPIGERAKSDVHTTTTPLHLAFSCYLFNDQGELLMTRRAISKQTWPGVWTNSFCGHPAPEEKFEDAIKRRAAQELGTTVQDIRCELPKFSYRAVDASGIVENEVCPVFSARIEGSLRPCSSEVSEWAWVRPEALATALPLTPFAFSPWLREQLPQLHARGLWGKGSIDA
ncbi:isopentenyl-diphosphate Delta-isomerase [Leucobacter sp. HY1908]